MVHLQQVVQTDVDPDARLAQPDLDPLVFFGVAHLYDRLGQDLFFQLHEDPLDVLLLQLHLLEGGVVWRQTPTLLPSGLTQPQQLLDPRPVLRLEVADAVVFCGVMLFLRSSRGKKAATAEGKGRELRQMGGLLLEELGGRGLTGDRDRGVAPGLQEALLDLQDAPLTGQFPFTDNFEQKSVTLEGVFQLKTKKTEFVGGSGGVGRIPERLWP